MRWRLGLRPRPRWGSLRPSPSPRNRKRQRTFGARHSLFRVHFYISISLPGPSLTEFLDPPLLAITTDLLDCRYNNLCILHFSRAGKKLRFLKNYIFIFFIFFIF